MTDAKNPTTPDDVIVEALISYEVANAENIMNYILGSLYAHGYKIVPLNVENNNV